MTRQLFIYYRIPKAEIALGMACAHQFMATLHDQGLGSGELFQREESDKPYFTVMEVITPAPAHLANIEEFIHKVQQLATACFLKLPDSPSRHVEVFRKVATQDFK